MKKEKTVIFRYKGFECEVRRFYRRDGKEGFTYYIRIPLERIKANKTPRTGEYEHQICKSFHFHNGCTWCRRTDTDLEIGCDYQHKWEENDKKYIAQVIKDCKRSVNRHLEAINLVKCFK